MINTKLPSCVDIIRSTSLGFPADALKALILRTPASRAPAVKPSWCTADYINTLGWFCIFIYAWNTFTGYSAYGLVLSGSTRKYSFNHYSIHKYHKNKIMMLQAILAEESNCCLTLRQYLIHLIRLFYQENVLHSSRHIAQMVHSYKWVGTGFGWMTIKKVWVNC